MDKRAQTAALNSRVFGRDLSESKNMNSTLIQVSLSKLLSPNFIAKQKKKLMNNTGTQKEYTVQSSKTITKNM